MASKQSQITSRIKATIDAELQNSDKLKKEISSMMDKLVPDSKFNRQYEKMLNSIVEAEKRLSQMRRQNTTNDSGLNDLKKYSAELENIAKLYASSIGNMNSPEFIKSTKEYKATVEKTEKEIADIKKKYAETTGSSFDTDLKSINKVIDKYAELKKQISDFDVQSKTQEQYNRQLEETNNLIKEQNLELQKKTKIQATAKKAYEDSVTKQLASSSSTSLNAENIKEYAEKRLYKTSYSSLDQDIRQLQELENIRTKIDKVNEEYKDEEERIKKINELLNSRIAKELKISDAKKASARVDESILILQDQILKKQENIDIKTARTIEATAQKASNEIYRAESTTQNKNNDAIVATQAALNQLQSKKNDLNNDTNLDNIKVSVEKELNDLQTDFESTNNLLTVIVTAMQEIRTQLLKLPQFARDETKEFKDINDTIIDVGEVGVNATNVDGKTTRDLVKTTISSGRQASEKYSNFMDTAYYKVIKESFLDSGKAQDFDEYDYNALEAKFNWGRSESLLSDKEAMSAMGLSEEQIKQQIADFQKEFYTNSLKATQELIKILENPENIDKRKATPEKVETIIQEAKLYIQQLEAFLAGESAKGPVNAGDQLSNSFANLRQEMEKGVEEAGFLGTILDDLGNKVKYFLSAAFIFQKISTSIREAAAQTKELDKDMTQIGLVLGKTSSEVWKNFDTYASMADRLSTTTSDVVGAMKLFYQQGLSTVEVNKMVEASAIAAALGETSMAEASETLTAVINSYNLSATEAMSVTDKISQVAIVSAADFNEISTAVSKVASSAATAGVDLDHLMGYLATMIETTREAPTNIGTALKTIIANFEQFKEAPDLINQTGSEINKVDIALKSVGISLTDGAGQVRDLDKVLDELGQMWDGLDRNQKSYLATQIAGTRQQSRFYALMNDWARTQELVGEATKSDGKATQQFALYQNSLTAATKRLDNEWQKFLNNITKEDGILKTLTNTATGFLKVANKIGPTLTTAFGTASIAGIRRWINIIRQGAKETAQLRGDLLNSPDKVDILSSTRNYGTNPLGMGGSVARGGVKLAQKFGAFKNVDAQQKQVKELTKQINILTAAQDKFGESGANITEVINSLTSAEEQKIVQDTIANTLAEINNAATAEGAIISEADANAKIKGAISAKLDGDMQQRDAIMKKLNTSITWSEVAAQLALNLAILAGIAIIVGVAAAIYNAITAEERHAERAKESAATVTQAYQSISDAFKEVKETLENYEESKKALEDLKKGTAEWKEKVDELNDSMLEVMRIYPQLAKYMSLDNNGILTLSEEGIKAFNTEQEEAIKKARMQMLEGQIASYKATNDVNMKNAHKDTTNYWGRVGGISLMAGGGILSTLAMPFTVGGSLSGFAASEAIGAAIAEGADGISEDNMKAIAKAFKDNANFFNTKELEANLKDIGITNGLLIDRIIDAKDEIQNTAKNINELNDTINSYQSTLVQDYLSTSVNQSSEFQNSKYQSIIAEQVAKNTSQESIDQIYEKEYKDNGKLKAGKTDKEIAQEYAALMGYIEYDTLSGNKAKYKQANGEWTEEIDDEIARRALARAKYYKGLDEEAKIQAINIDDIEQQIAKATGLEGDSLYSVTSKLLQGEIDFASMTPEETQKLKTLLAGKIATKYIDLLPSQEEINKQFDKNDRFVNVDKIVANANIASSNAKQADTYQSKIMSGEKLDNDDLEALTALENKYTQLKTIRDKNSSAYAKQLQNIRELEEQEAVAQLKNAQTQLINSIKNQQQELNNTKKTDKEILEDKANLAKQLKDLYNVNYEMQIAIEANIDSDIQDLLTSSKNFNSMINSMTEGLKLTTDQVEEYINNGYGAMLINSKALADGTIQLDKEVVSQYIKDQGDILEADSQSKIQRLQNQKDILENQLKSLKAQQTALEAVVNAEDDVQQESAWNAYEAAQTEYQYFTDMLEQEQEEYDNSNIRMTEEAEKFYNGLKGIYETNEENIETSLESEDKAERLAAENVVNYWNARERAVANYSEAIEKLKSGKLVVAKGAVKVAVKNSDIKSLSDLENVVSDYSQGEKFAANEFNSEFKNLNSDDRKAVARALLNEVNAQIAATENRIGSIDGTISQLEANKALKNLKSNAAANGNPSEGSGFEEQEGAIERFYNKLRKIEDISNRIAKIQSNRSFADLLDNYSTDDYHEENQLLKERISIYQQLHIARLAYLEQQRKEIESTYGDLAYFTETGVIQLYNDMEDIKISSEEQQERFQKFSEAISEYQEMYNASAEDVNTILEDQTAIIENIKTAWEKIIKKNEDYIEYIKEANNIANFKKDIQFSPTKAWEANIKIADTLKQQLDALHKDEKQYNAEMAQAYNQLMENDLLQYLVYNKENGSYSLTDEAKKLGVESNVLVNQAEAIAAHYNEANVAVRKLPQQIRDLNIQMKQLVETYMTEAKNILDSYVNELSNAFKMVDSTLSKMEKQEELFGKTTQTIQAQFDTIAKGAAMANNELQTLEELTKDVEEELENSDYAQYMQRINGELFINRSAIENMATEAGDQMIISLLDKYEELKKAQNETSDNYYNYLDKLQQMEKEKQQATISLIDEVHDELMEIDNEEVTNLQDKYKEMTQLDNEYYSNLQQKISDARRNRQIEQEGYNITELSNKLAINTKDTSTAYSSSTRDLRKQLQDALQSQADNEIDRELERIQREQKERQEDRDLQIQQMQNLITFKDENGIYWEQSQQLFESGRQELESFLANRYAEENISQASLQDKLENLNSNVDVAFADLSKTVYTGLAEEVDGITEIQKTTQRMAEDTDNSLENITEIISNFAEGFVGALGDFVSTLEEETSGITTRSSDLEGDTIEGIKNQMQINSDAWNRDNERIKQLQAAGESETSAEIQALKEHQDELHKTNLYLKEVLEQKGELLFYNSNGSYYTKDASKYYATGGIVDYTGNAHVDGTPTKPEAFLNAKQTELFAQLRDILVSGTAKFNSNTAQTNENVSIDNLTISVKEIADVDSIDKLTKAVKKSIYNDSTKNGTIRVSGR